MSWSLKSKASLAVPLVSLSSMLCDVLTPL